MAEAVENLPEMQAGSSNLVDQSSQQSDTKKTESNSVLERRQKKAEVAALYNENVNKNMEKRLEFLINESQIYSHFIANSKKRDASSGQVPANDSNAAGRATSSKSSAPKEPMHIHKFTSTPKYIKNGEMRDYQIAGVNWMISLYENGISGILADEMGLGKTLQTIAFIGYLKHMKKLPSQLKYLIIVPKSTIQNWLNEFRQWCPSISIVALDGEKKARKAFIKEKIRPGKWDVMITAYHMAYVEEAVLRKFTYHTMILDEGHKIKNEESLTARKLRELNSNHRMILTGTPIHNNLHELWSLMNFLLPDIFNSGEDFDRWFENQSLINDENITKRLKTIIKPFLLRRIKADVEKSLKPKQELKVYVGMPPMQLEWYRKILLQELTEVTPLGFKRKKYLENMAMQLRKVTNHPYLFEGAEDGPPFYPGEHLIENSGKMVILDKLLARFKQEGSRVLIFSQMVRMLNIIEDYCVYRNYTYCRLDGNNSTDERTEQMKEFNKPDSDKFLFLLSTRAGGLGINLATADTVIIYDSDWNPQMDLQAMDRAHRIGQKKQVRIFRLIAEKSIDERIVECSELKFALDHKLIKSNQTEILTQMKKNVAAIDMETHLEGRAVKLADEDLDTLLQRCEMRHKQEAAEKEDQFLLRHKYESVYKFDGEDFKEKQEQLREERKKCESYFPRWKRQGRIKENSVLPYYFANTPHWFYPPRLVELLEKDKLYFMRINKIYNGEENLKLIIKAKPLNVLEDEEYRNLLSESFNGWSESHFNRFIDASARYGRDDIQRIARAVSMPIGKVESYHEVFWQRYTELPNYQDYINRIEGRDVKISLKRSRESEEDEGAVAVSPKRIFLQYPIPRKRAFSEPAPGVQRASSMLTGQIPGRISPMFPNFDDYL
ncbi:chromatin-remodeling complex ATPase chain Iswi [Sergentomyia squamirostris]